MSLSEIINKLLDYLNPVVPIIIGAAVAVFIWGLAKLVLASGNEESIKKGKELMIWGSIGLFVMFAVWGLVSLLVNTFSDISPNDAPVDTRGLRRDI